MFEKLMQKSDECCGKAIEFFKKGEIDLATFFKNASVGFKERALNLRVE